MGFLPGWDSADSTATIAHGLHITAIVVLGLLVVAEAMALVYDSRKEHLVGVSALETETKHENDTKAAEARHTADITEARDAAKAANDELAELRQKRSPRHLSDAVRDQLVEALSPFNGQQVKITSNSGDVESDAFANEFYNVVIKARWNCLNKPGSFEGIFVGYPIGVEVTLNLADMQARHAPPSTAAAYNALMAVLHKAGIVNENEPAFANAVTPSGLIEIRVGFKPDRPGETSADLHPERTIRLPEK
jgi:hypothetical protein